jgi:hypothetical protein
MKGHSVSLASFVLLLLAFAPSAALAYSAPTYVRSHGFTHRDRTPHVHDNTPKPRRHHNHK